MEPSEVANDTSLEHQFQGLGAHYNEAAGLGFPAFLRSIEDSTPINATPYVIGWSQFAQQAMPPPKRALLDVLGQALERLPEIGLKPEVLLVGGSFLRSDAAPNDLDCALFYSGLAAAGADLGAWQRARRMEGLDLRLMPIEMDSVMVLKTAIFFAVLYTVSRSGASPPHGVVLVDCTR